MHVDDLTADTVDELISVFSHGQTGKLRNNCHPELYIDYKQIA